MKRQATVYNVDGTSRDITPPPRMKIQLAKLQEIVDGNIQCVPLPDGRELICNENGVFDKLPVNAAASAIWRAAYPIEKYPHNNVPVILGNIVIATRGCI